MASCTVNFSLKDAGYANYAGQTLYFRLKSAGAESSGDYVVARSAISATSDASGDGSVTLWVNGDSGISSIYEVTLPGGERIEFIVPVSTATIELANLLVNNQPSGANTQQATVNNNLNAFAADPSSNSSYAATEWRVDLGLPSAIPADGTILVSDGTSYVGESGATARASLGLGSSAVEEASVFQARSERNQASGYAGLNSSGMLDSSVFPAFFVTGGIEFSQIFSGDYVSGGTTTA